MATPSSPMPSQRVTHQSLVFTVSLTTRWHLLGARGKFCLPYLRQQHQLERPVDLQTQINTLERITGAFYLLTDGMMTLPVPRPPCVPGSVTALVH